MQRRFRLRGVLGPSFSSAYGIPQGDPLSPICLNALQAALCPVGFRPLVEAALQDPSVVGPAWRRQLRDAWRCCKWQLASKMVFIALHCLRAWMSDADSLQSAIDAGKASNPPEPEPKLDVRARLGVLRRRLPGGLNTRDCNCRNSRHRKQGSSQCVCGLDVESVLHISWDCPLLSSVRGDLAVLCSQLPSPLPACFRVGFEAPAALVAKIHCRLVDVWQECVGRWHAQSLAPLPRYRILGKRLPPAWYVAPPPRVNAKGHVLKAVDSSGVFCVKCGRSQRNWKQRWKITSLECRLKHVPQEEWLSQPSGNFHLNPNRITFASLECPSR